MSKQTAVDWLIEQLKEYDFAELKDTENYIIKIPAWVLTEKQEKSKSMEKEQIMQVQMAAKLYECRDSAKRFFCEEYAIKLQPYKDLIFAVMKANNIDVIPALLKISQTETYNDNEMTQMLFMAATVELIEPSV